MKSLEYFPETDTLHITLSSTSASGGAENAGSDGEHQDIILSYNDKDKLVSITIENASKGVDLNDILSGHAKIVRGKIETIYSISELAEKLDITPRTLRNTIHSMRASGIDIGKQYGPTYPILLSEHDAQKIVQWRNEHPRGRPKLVLESKQLGNSYVIAFEEENMESHSVWQYLAPADRETFVSGTICWLMDPKGDHGLGNRLLSIMLEKLELLANTNSELTIRPEVTAGRDKRFDICVYENDNLIAVFEVKCKTSGSRDQIKKIGKYAEQTQTRLGRIAFDEWNFPDLNEDERTDYPLITFAKLADEISRQTSTEEHPFVSSFAYHLKQEAEFFQKLRDFFIEETEAEPPKLPTIHRFSDRFCNKLFWHWFKEHSRKRNLLKTEPTTNSEQSGVWFVSEGIRISGSLSLPELNLNLSGSFSYWIRIEFHNKTGILGKKDEDVGYIQIRITEDNGCRDDLFHQIKNADLGCKFQPRKMRPKPTDNSWYALQCPLKLEDFRFSKLHESIELLTQQSKS